MTYSYNNVLYLNDCLAEFSVSEDCIRPCVLTHIEVKVTHPQHGNVASLLAVKINRNACHDKFLEVMDESSPGLMRFGTKLFDKYGMLKPWLVENDHHKGSGCWGFELNKGILAYVLHVGVNVAVSFPIRIFL